MNVDVFADTAQFDDAMRALTDATEDFGRVFSSTIRGSIKSGRGFEDVLKNLGKRFTDLALNRALKPLDNLLGNVLGSLTGGLSGTTIPGFASGGVFSNGGITPFAQGGIVNGPSLFRFQSGTGVMGESGPEAVMPLRRGNDGKLGVAASTGKSSAVNVVFNVQATDAASFRKSEGQISAMLARAVSRGQRGI